MDKTPQQKQRKPISARWFRFLMNFWPPFFGAGIKVTFISPDYRRVEVRLKQHWFNSNYVGTHFGGSMYAMSDAFYMLILIKNLGQQYIVWDKAAYIDFKKPGRGIVRATFTFSDEELDFIRREANKNEKYIFDKSVDLIDEKGIVVATVIKTLYVRKKAAQ